jgi:hypothetical protein
VAFPESRQQIADHSNGRAVVWHWAGADGINDCVGLPCRHRNGRFGQLHLGDVRRERDQGTSRGRWIIQHESRCHLVAAIATDGF